MLKKVLEERYKSILAIIITIATIVLLISNTVFNTANNQESTYSINDNSTLILTHIPSGSTLSLEVASTPQKRESGLMFRKELEKDSGMLFIFSTESDLSFWMRNTSISLDMIFLDKDLKVTSIESNTKILQTSEIYNSKEPSQFVIEVLAGWAFEHKYKKAIYSKYRV